MQCPVCSKEVDAQSAFCNNCGASMAAAAPESAVPPPQTGYTTVAEPAYSTVPPPAYGAVPPPAYGAMPSAAVGNPGLSENAAAALSYVTFIPAIIFLVIEPFNKMPLVRFHSWQSIGLFVGAVILQVAITICEIILHFIPFIILLFTLVHLVVGVGLFILWLFCVLKASKGEWYKLPFIGAFAEKQARG